MFFNVWLLTVSRFYKRPLLWSEFLATDLEVPGSILELGPLSLVSTIKELLGRECNGSGKKTDIMAIGIR
jgi:hypothetical protein